MNIQYGASRHEIQTILQCLDDKTLKGVFAQLQLDLRRKNWHYFFSSALTVVLITGLSLGLLFHFNDRFLPEETFRYWAFRLTVCVFFPMAGTWSLSASVSKPYWTWMGQFRIWLNAVDHETLRRYGYK